MQMDKILLERIRDLSGIVEQEEQKPPLTQILDGVIYLAKIIVSIDPTEDETKLKTDLEEFYKVGEDIFNKTMNRLREAKDHEEVNLLKDTRDILRMVFQRISALNISQLDKTYWNFIVKKIGDLLYGYKLSSFYKDMKWNNWLRNIMGL